MKQLFFILFLILPSLLSKGQVGLAEDSDTASIQHIIIPSMTQASFPGGYSDYIKSTILYPKEARKNGIEGSVFILCIIDSTGAITEAQIKKGVHPLLDNEALRVINAMPNWTPYTLDGKPRKCRIIIPIRFSLSQ
jgi:TonB family protein